MSQYHQNGPVMTPGYSMQQRLPHAMSPNGAMQPGHNHCPTSSAQYPTQGLQYYPLYTLATPAISPPQVSSRTPSPSLPPSVPSSLYPSVPASYPQGPNQQNLQFFSLLSQWPMNGPSYPAAMNAHIANRGPMPDLSALQTQMTQVNTGLTGGHFDLPNPIIADPRCIAKSWTDGIDVYQTPWVIADPRIHGAPLPPPEPLPVIPEASAINHANGTQVYNGLFM